MARVLLPRRLMYGVDYCRMRTKEGSLRNRAPSFSNAATITSKRKSSTVKSPKGTLQTSKQHERPSIEPEETPNKRQKLGAVITVQTDSTRERETGRNQTESMTKNNSIIRGKSRNPRSGAYRLAMGKTEKAEKAEGAKTPIGVLMRKARSTIGSSSGCSRSIHISVSWRSALSAVTMQRLKRQEALFQR